MNLKNRTVVITGAAAGIGRACAERFVAEGARVAIADIDAARLAEAADSLRVAGGLVHPVIADVSRRAEVDRIVAETTRVFGRLDIMVNNAGIAMNQEFLDITEADLDKVMGVNLKGAFFGVQAAARQMIAQGDGGAIINMSSINALLANPLVATYAMSKGAMNQLTNLAAVALAPHKIRVAGVGPGTIRTEMVAASILTSDAARRAVLSRTPIGRCGEPAEIASVVAFLASEDASYITGQTLYPDGGRLCLNYTVPIVAPDG